MSCYIIKPALYKKLHKNYLKTKAWGVARVVGVARDKFPLKF